MIFNILIFLFVAAGICAAQTKPNIGDLRGPKVPAMSALLISPDGSMQFVAIDTTTIAVKNGVLSAIPLVIGAQLPKRVVEITQTAAAVVAYTLAAAPNGAAELDIFWNGICLSAGLDYTVAGNAVTFTGTVPGSGAAGVLRVVYRSN